MLAMFLPCSRRRLLHASALIDDLHAPPSNVRHQRRTFQSDCYPARFLWLANGARFERPARRNGSVSRCVLTVGFELVLRDVERVALSVTEAVEHRGAEAMILTDPLDERLRFTPVLAQVAPLCNDERILGTRLKHLLQLARCFRFVGDRLERQVGILVVVVTTAAGLYRQLHSRS